MNKIQSCLLSFLALTSYHAAAQSVVISDAFLDRLSDYDTTLVIEKQLVDALSGNEKKALRQLAIRIKKEDGGDVKQLLLAIKPTQLDEIALKLGPCHYAGLLIRTIITQLVEGRVKVKRQQGFLRLNPSGFDDQFAEHMHRCEHVKKHSKTERKIGTSCLVNGQNCFDGD